jgi:hypothetical protein
MSVSVHQPRVSRHSVCRVAAPLPCSSSSVLFVCVALSTVLLSVCYQTERLLLIYICNIWLFQACEAMNVVCCNHVNRNRARIIIIIIIIITTTLLRRLSDWLLCESGPKTYCYDLPSVCGRNWFWKVNKMVCE